MTYFSVAIQHSEGSSSNPGPRLQTLSDWFWVPAHPLILCTPRIFLCEKSAGAWCWSLISTKRRGWDWMELHLHSPLYLDGKYGSIWLLPFTPKLAERRNRNRQKISPRIAVIWPKSEIKHLSLLHHLSALWIHDVTITFRCSVCMMMTPAITILISNWLVSSCLNATKWLLFSIFWTGQTHLTRPAIDHV